MASVALSSITGTYISSEFNDDFNKEGFAGTIAQQTIYGRCEETSKLLKTYQTLLQTQKAETVFVHGESGSGKTLLVDVLRNQACNGSTPAYFVTGKYFQNSGGIQEAHSAIMAAFSDLCDLVAQSDDFDQSRQDQIKGDLGSYALLLVKSISNLSPFIGNTFKQMEVDAAVMKSKFAIACKTFLRAMASEEHPIILFLDDVQWADEGSRQLIEVFLQDSELKNVMLVLAYRDEEAAQVDAILEHAQSPVDIQLSNLDEEAVYQIVSSVTGSTSSEGNIRALSNLVAKRTAGNPFHVMVFMETIEVDGLLVFDDSSGELSCTFDVDEIQSTVMASESLADLLTRKMDRLSGDITEILKVASLLGYAFDESILVSVASTLAEELGSSGECVPGLLADAAKEGFVEKTSCGYQFTHDKLQAAFQSLLDEEEEDQLHLLIGKAFLTSSNDESKMYNAAVHLNNAPGFLSDRKQWAVLAGINFKAATYCGEKSAFIQAVALLRVGLDIIESPEERWSEQNFSLTFKMMESLARMQLIVGDFTGCKSTTKEALRYSKTVEMQVNLLVIDVEVRMAGCEFDLSAAFRALSILGVSMPETVKARHLIGKIVRVKRMLSRKTDKDVMSLPIKEENSLFSITVKILMHVCCYSFSRDEPIPGFYAALLATELTLNTGLAPYSPAAFAMYGLTEVKSADRAYRYGKLAISMLDRLPCKEAECYTVSYVMSALLSLKEPLGQMIDPILRAADAGNQRGDLLHAALGGAQALHMLNYIGAHLATVETSMRARYAMMEELNQPELLLLFQPALQYVIHMQRDLLTREDISTMSGEILNEETYFQNEPQFHRLVGLLVKAELATYLKEFVLAESLFKQVEAIKDGVQSFYFASFFYLNAARTHFELYKQTAKRKHLWKGRSLRKSLERKESNGCPNAGPLIAFLDAEKLAKKATDEGSLRLIYDRGIDCLVEHRFVSFEGMLNEKAGFDFARRGWYAGAEAYFERALHIYGYEWGATAKYNRLVDTSRRAMVGKVEVPVASPYGTCITVGSGIAGNSM